jgi:Ca-activated chloride channel family protein
MNRVRFSARPILSLFILILAVASCTQPQSTDDVHVTPRPGITEPLPSGSLPPLERDPSLRHLKPLRVDVDLVLVPVTVTDSMNRMILDLKQPNFRIYENEQEQEIHYFAVEDAPISVGLVLDLSKSMSNKFVTERAAVEEFFGNANTQDDYFVVTFADRPRVCTTATQSIEDIQQGLAAEVPDGHTALFDAVYLAMAKMRSARYPRRVLLIISDGGDNHSRYGLKEVKSLAQEADVGIYAIGVFDSMLFRSFEEFMGSRWLREITDVTSGHTVSVDNFKKLPEIAASLSREMRSQYVLGYRPRHPTRDGKWRKIRVQVTPPPDSEKLQAYYKKGYLAPAR